MEKNAEEHLIPLSSDECGQSGVDSDEDVITTYLPMAQRSSGSGPLVPTISVTPHSPAAKHYPVLEDSLQQLHEIHEKVQQMRDFPAAILNPNTLRLQQCTRLSVSCPSLNEAPLIELEPHGSVGSSPVHESTSRKGSETHEWLLARGLEVDAGRRRSWTAVEDLSGKKKMVHGRQRSMSLSSMESEADESSLLDNVDGSTARLLGTDPLVAAASRRGARGSGGGASTHSLNEADLQNDFNKIKAKREAEQLRLLPARLPLQKSISTPSINAVRDMVLEPTLVGAQPTLPTCRPSGTESETEEEGSRQGSALGRFDIPGTQLSLHHLLLQDTAYDHHSEKRRKRGSLFFRKKKDKNKKVNHQWVSACYGSSNTCDVCSKPLNNKPALFCENCTTTVHQNTCKDNIIDCSKPKGSKNSNKLSSFSVSNTKGGSLAKRGSSSGSGHQNSSSSSQIISEDKEADQHHLQQDGTNFPDDVPLLPLEFLSDTPITATDLDADPALGLHDDEPESWSPTVGKEVTKKLKEKEIKRQEHIYEFILTEKHHCLTLLVMQKIFVEGLQKYFQLGPSVERMFPRLADLTAIHLQLMLRLRQRQKESPIVSTIADILLEQFSLSHAARLKSAYGEFCSRHRDAVDIYKYYLQSDARFSQFVRHCQNNPLLKKKGIPECILFVTQRLTKYPLLIEPLIKTSKDNKAEQEQLQKALALVKEILVEVDSQVAEKEKEDRKLEIYNRIDAKSYTIHRGHKFKKSDILQGNRSLRFEGVAMLMQGRGKMQIVLVIVLSDVLFFLQENSHKYTFFTPDNKAGVVSLQKLLVREKAGQEFRGIYLISSNPSDPEMFELKVHKPKDKQVWIQAIRDAVQNCPDDQEESISGGSEEKQQLINAKQNEIKKLIGQLRQKDVEQALLLEGKMSLHYQLLAAATGDEVPASPPSYRHLVSEQTDTSSMWKEVLKAVQEVSQLASSLYTSGTNLSRSVSSVGEHQSETYVSPILPKRAETFGGFDSSVPIKALNKKLQSASASQAGTPDCEQMKAGDAIKLFEKMPWRNVVLPPVTPMNDTYNGGGSTVSSDQMSVSQETPNLLTLGREQQQAAVQLSHCVYTLLSIISHLMTTIDSLQAQLATFKSQGGGSGDRTGYRHNQQLEELRNLQDKLSAEKTAWQQLKEQQQRELDEKQQELIKLQEQIRAEQSDITQQREQLYRKMEMLTNQGLLISPNVALPIAPVAHDESGPFEDSAAAVSVVSQVTESTHSSSTTFSQNTENRKKPDTKWKSTTSKSSLPLNLISATNQQKVAQNIPIKQQLPLKLATRLSNTGLAASPSLVQQIPQQVLPLKLSQDDKTRRSSSGYQRLGSDSQSPGSDTVQSPPAISHSRTGSSPASMQNSPPGGQPTSTIGHHSNKAARTNTYPKLPDKFRVQSPDQPPPANDEKVIFF